MASPSPSETAPRPELSPSIVHFDLDGTLIDSARDLAASTNEVRRSFELDALEPEAIIGLVGRGARVLVEKALGVSRDDLFEEGVRRFLAHYELHCLDETRAFPGMEALVDELRRRGVVVTVVTNKPEHLARKILDGLGWTGRIDYLVGGDTFPERKPHPRGVVAAHAAFHLPLREGVLVGDSSVDVETARAAGMPSIGVAWGFDPDGLEAAGPGSWAEDVAALEGMLLR